MKIIDLFLQWLNNESMPKTIVYKNDLYYWNERLKDYTTSLDPNVIDSNTYFIEQLDFEELNNEVKIIEDTSKKIEKIQTSVNEKYIGWSCDEKVIIKDIINLADKINEIIDEINRQKS